MLDHNADEPQGEPDVPTPIDQIRPEVLASWDRWIRDRQDKTKQYTTAAPKGRTPQVRDRPLAVDCAPNGSWNDLILSKKRDNY